ncbi:NEAT domain-containing protein [Sporosarcina sp. YIM B06819]|uniref:NEAT domain-containing protein n=1 Tax=Sporosarcina sp. YIM B06819 TaxID=3081769 RepID=UPI00298C0AE3|nr:NEAT domain-containing protein [Sporosarcina sp. YIM B06819]
MKKNVIIIVAMLFMLIVPAVAPQAASPYADGEYTVPFSVLKDTGSEPSATAEYVVNPAKLIVQNGNMHVIMTLNNSSWWQYFKVNGTEVQVVSEDEANDKRVVKFEVKDLDQLVSAKIHIIVTGIPGFTYDNKYDIRFKFNSTNIPLAPVVEKPAPTPTTKPAETEKATSTPMQKPSTKDEKKQEVTPKVEEKPASAKDEAVSQKTEVAAVEKGQAPTETVEQTEPVDAEASTIKEDSEATANEDDAKEEDIEIEEEPEVIEEQAVEEVEADSTSKSSPIWIFIIVAIVLAGGVLLFTRKRKS